MTAPLQFRGWAVDLDEFSGPLDLLLSLIRREQIDVFDIPIARITDQYLAALDQMREDRVTVSGEFMVMAAALMQIKSRLLLPRPPREPGADEAEDDPRAELVQLILEYERYRAGAETLGELAAARSRLFAVPGERVDAGPVPLRQATVSALLQAYGAVLQRAVEPEPPVLSTARFSVEEQAQRVLRCLAAGAMSFADLFGDRPPKLEVVATFMALLELVRDGRIRAEQDESFGPIRLALAA